MPSVVFLCGLEGSVDFLVVGVEDDVRYVEDLADLLGEAVDVLLPLIDEGCLGFQRDRLFGDCVDRVGEVRVVEIALVVAEVVLFEENAENAFVYVGGDSLRLLFRVVSANTFFSIDNCAHTSCPLGLTARATSDLVTTLLK